MAFVGVDWSRPVPNLDVVLRTGRPVRVPVEHSVTTASGRLVCQPPLFRRVGAARGPSSFILVMFGNGTATKGGDDDQIALTLPPGSYQMQVDVVSTATERLAERGNLDFTVPEGVGLVELPPFRIEAPPLRKLAGQPAPEIDARDSVTGAPVRLTDLRGKVVIVDFWGYWCGPCLGVMPNLMAIYDEFRGQPLAIVALHDQSIQSLDELRAKVEHARRSFWDNRDFPFPVAFDKPEVDLKPDDPGIGGGTTARRYQVNSWPSTLLIDHEGKVIEKISLHNRAEAVAKVREALSKVPPR